LIWKADNDVAIDLFLTGTIAHAQGGDEAPSPLKKPVSDSLAAKVDELHHALHEEEHPRKISTLSE
jgi:hypothetical protein